jgi:hypothetical protein
VTINAQAYIRLCNIDPTPPITADPQCSQLLIPVSALSAPSFDHDQMVDLFNAVIYIVVIVFIIGIIKKAIEQ